MSSALKRLLAALVFPGIPLLYFVFLPVSYSFDGTVFSQMLRYALLKHDWLGMVQIHHLLYFPLNYLVYRALAALFHYRVLEFFHLQMFSMFFGVATLLLVERTLKKLGLDAAAAPDRRLPGGVLLRLLALGGRCRGPYPRAFFHHGRHVHVPLPQGRTLGRWSGRLSASPRPPAST